MFRTPLRRAAAIALGAATLTAAAAFPAAADTPLDTEFKATAKPNAVEYEVKNKTAGRTVNGVQFDAPPGVQYGPIEGADNCVTEGTSNFCQVAIEPGQSKKLVAQAPGGQAGKPTRVCTYSYGPPFLQQCLDGTINADGTPKDPPPTQTPSTPQVNVAADPPQANAVAVDLRQLLSCKCDKILVGAIRLYNKKGNVKGVQYATIHDNRGKHRAGFGLRTQLVCTQGIFPDQCFGRVDIKAPKGIKLDAKTKKIACVGICGDNPTQDTFVRMSGKAATERTEPLTFEVTTTCADGTTTTTDLTFAFDARGNIDVKDSDLGEGLDAPPAKPKPAPKKAAKKGK
jgi:hypothetical protein